MSATALTDHAVEGLGWYKSLRKFKDVVLVYHIHPTGIGGLDTEYDSLLRTVEYRCWVMGARKSSGSLQKHAHNNGEKRVEESGSPASLFSNIAQQ